MYSKESKENAEHAGKEINKENKENREITAAIGKTPETDRDYAEDNEPEEEKEEKSLSFEYFTNLQPEILRSLQDLKFSQMTPIQKEAIPLLLEGRDVIGQAQTGTGKTAAFGIPVLNKVNPENKNLQAVILCPTRELAMQAADDLRGFAKYMQGVKVLPVYGGQEIGKQIKSLKGVQVVVGTPGRVMDHMRRHTIRMDQVNMVILDEADEMLDMGFREDMEVILGEITAEHQTCLFSATMPQEILNLTERFQKEPVFVKITRQELTVDSIRQYSYGVKHEYKTQALMRLLSFYRYNRCIVFCNTKAMVDELCNTLTRAGFAAEGLHGDLSQGQRDAVMGRFRSGILHILIATDIAARGLDVDDVEAVINYDMPIEAEYYVHRIGRTGRAGKEGVSHSLCSSKEFRKVHQIEGVIHARMEERRIPSVNDIKAAQEVMMFDRVMECLNEGHSGNLIPMIRNYCGANGISIEAFAAAALKMQMMDSPEDVDVDLPEQKKKGKSRWKNNTDFWEREASVEDEDDYHKRRGPKKDAGYDERKRHNSKDDAREDDHKRRSSKEGAMNEDGKYTVHDHHGSRVGTEHENHKSRSSKEGENRRRKESGLPEIKAEKREQQKMKKDRKKYKK